MSFNYQPMTEQEALNERFQLLKDGIYDAVITKSEDRQSSSGNPMMDMTVSVYDDNGKEHSVRDFLVFMPVMMWKVINCAKSAWVLKEYEAGEFCSQVVIRKRVKVKIVTEPGKEIPVDKLNGKPRGSLYPDKNKIEDYISDDDEAALNHDNTNAMNNDLNDDVPF